jgi:3-oxoacyl-[acyl-carrier-protein] synthase-3
VLQPSSEETGLLASHLGCEGDALDALLLPNFGTAGNRFCANYGVFGVRFDGREIFRRAVKGMAGEIAIVLQQLGLENKDIDLVVPHQANARIIESLAKHLDMDMRCCAQYRQVRQYVRCEHSRGAGRSARRRTHPAR